MEFLLLEEGWERGKGDKERTSKGWNLVCWALGGAGRGDKES